MTIQMTALPEGLTFGVMRRGSGPTQRLSIGAKSISAEVNGQYVGHIFWNAETGEVEDIWINPDWQRRGIGTALWNRAREQDPNVRHSETQTQPGAQWAKSVGSKTASRADSVYGKGQAGLDLLFPEGTPRTSQPWGSTAGPGPKGLPYDADRVKHVLASPGLGTHLREFDPRKLRATQPNITRAGVSYYLGDEYERSGKTFADQGNIGNRYPVVYTREDTGEHLLLSGHHRAVSDLLRGRPFRAIEVRGPAGVRRNASRDSDPRGRSDAVRADGGPGAHSDRGSLRDPQGAHRGAAGGLVGPGRSSAAGVGSRRPSGGRPAARGEDGLGAVLAVTHDYEGEVGNRDHITRGQRGTVATEEIAHLLGVKGERPGEHRNRQGPEWEKFLDDIRTNGVREPIFITVDYGEEPKISEGNHRRDAVVELGMPSAPVEVRYFGHAEHQHNLKVAAAPFRPTRGMFAPGQDHLDPRVFTPAEDMRPEVRQAVLDRLDAFLRPRYGDWAVWTKVYLAGSGASYWWDSDVDFDVLLGLDLDAIVAARPQNAGLTEAQVCLSLNVGLKTLFDPAHSSDWFAPDSGPWEFTAFYNPGSWDIRNLKPYAAYDITANTWVQHPPVLPADWGPSYFPAWQWEICDRVAAQAEDLLAMPLPERLGAGTAVFDELHAWRHLAYTPAGDGWLDIGNVLYQFASQHPDHLLTRLYQCKHPLDPAPVPPHTAAISGVQHQEGTPLKDYAFYGEPHRFFITDPNAPPWREYKGKPSMGNFEGSDPKTVAFLDVFVQDKYVQVGFITTRGQFSGEGGNYQRRGLAGKLMQACYDYFPGKIVVWGKLMDDGAEVLKRRFRDRYPQRTSSRSRVAAYGSDLIGRGMTISEYPEALANKMAAGTATAKDLLDYCGPHLGVWWGIFGSFGDLTDFEDYSYGSGDKTLNLKGMREDGYVGKNYIAGEVEVVLIAKRPMHSSGVPWDPEKHNEVNPLMGNSSLETGQPLEMVEVRYDAGWGWKSLSAQGLRSMAATTTILDSAIGWGRDRDSRQDRAEGLGQHHQAGQRSVQLPRRRRGPGAEPGPVARPLLRRRATAGVVWVSGQRLQPAQDPEGRGAPGGRAQVPRMREGSQGRPATVLPAMTDTSISSTPSGKLLARLRTMGLDIPEGAELRRTNAGVHQRSAGAWSWYAVDANGAEIRLGSQHPITTLLKTDRLAATRAYGHHEDTHIDPHTGGLEAGRWASYVEERAR